MNVYTYIYIYILKSVYLGSKVIIQAGFVKDDGTFCLLFLILFFQDSLLFF